MPIPLSSNLAGFKRRHVYMGMGVAALVFSVATAAPALPPTDDDGDTTVTPRTDRDGYTLRPPRTTLLLSLNSLKNAALGAYKRLPMDSFEGLAALSGETKMRGTSLRIKSYANRAGDAYAPDSIEIEWSLEDAKQKPLYDDLAAGEDRDGYDILVPTSLVSHAMDSLLNADLRPASSVRSRYRTVHAPDFERRLGHDIRIQWRTAGRAGAVNAPFEIEIDWSLESATRIRKAIT